MTRRLTKITDVLLRQHSAVILMLHISLILWCLTFGWLLRYDFVPKNQFVIFSAAPILVLFRIVALSRFRLLHGHWRYTGVDDAAEILKATFVGSLAFFIALRIVFQVTSFPVSLYFIEGVLSACVLAGVRVGFRILAEATTLVQTSKDRRQVLVIGAGFAAQMIIRELRSAASGYWVVGCLDDDETKVGLRILGKPVLGTVDQLSELASLHDVKEVLIAVPSATGVQMRRFVHHCELAKVKFSTVPSLNDLISGKAQISELRNVDLDDLLGRKPISVDLDSVSQAITGRVVLVTGAAGSIGSELCRQILRYRPAKLLCLDQSETGLFYLQMELGNEGASYCVADYTNSERMRRLFAVHRIEIVFHAGAYKHVPLMEANLREALENNVFGLSSLLDIAEKAKCSAFVLISSDKAVNPSSFMGCTKRLGELMMGSRPNSGMTCVAVRFGNVLGSQGSVVPVFQKQLTEDRRLTVTHPDMTRYFMTIREAVALVLQASAIGTHGDVLVLDMGEPVRIVDLAKTLIRLSGRSEQEVDIVFTGLRPGEKLYEELFYEDEMMLDTQCPHIKGTRGHHVPWSQLRAQLDFLRHTMFKVGDSDIRRHVKEIIPQYSFNEGMEVTEISQPHVLPTALMSLTVSAADD